MEHRVAFGHTGLLADSLVVRWQVLKQISEGMVAFLMERSDHAKTIMRSVARELLCTCVLRALIGQFTPYNINKVSMLQLDLATHPFPLRPYHHTQGFSKFVG